MTGRSFPKWMEEELRDIEEAAPNLLDSPDKPSDAMLMMGAECAVILAFRGEPERARQCLAAASRWGWPFSQRVVSVGANWPGVYGHEPDDGKVLMRSALAAVLAGDRERARTLCQWAHETFQSIPERVMRDWLPGGKYESYTAGEVLMWDALAQLLLGADPATISPQFTHAQDILESWRKRVKLSLLHDSLWPRALTATCTGLASRTLPALAAARAALAALGEQPTNKRERLHGYFYAMALEAAFPDLIGGQDPLTIKRI